MSKVLKYIIITGGVLSGLGKGVVSASIGRLLSSKYKIVPIKCDGYLNVDPGTMNPIEHGEVFVLDDGGEVDLDFGHYERFLNINCKIEWNLTSGKIFQCLVEKERRGDFLGKTVQVIPHVTGEIRERFDIIAKKEDADVVIIEIGGTVGDIENLWFLEAARELIRHKGRENIAFVHLGLVPIIDEQGQQKTKPLQQSINLLRTHGIFPDIVIGRSKHALDEKTKLKLHWLSNLDLDGIVSDPDLLTVYELPLIFKQENMNTKLPQILGLEPTRNLEKWALLVESIKNPKGGEVTIAICGKYTELADSYISIKEALVHAGAHLNVRVIVKWIETTHFETNKLLIEKEFTDVDGMIVPGGFGSRGTEGKIKAIEYVRTHNIPFLGICYGLQLAVIEFARHICGLNDANSTEINPDTSHAVVTMLDEQKSVIAKGGTMRLGSYKAILKKGSIISSLYQQILGDGSVAHERHRHRYEVNPQYHEQLTKALANGGLIFSGMSEDGKLVEFCELQGHRYFVATQSHPELKSRLEYPAPLFYGLVKAAIEKKKFA